MLLFFSLVACTGTPSNNDDSGDSGTDSGDAVTSCLSFHGIQSDSSKWKHVYDSTSYSDDSVWNIEVTAYDPVAGTATLQTLDFRTYANGANSQDNLYDYDYFCNEEGLFLTELRQDNHTTQNGVETDGTNTYEYDPPMLVRPGSLAVGDTWRSQSDYVATNQDGNHSTGQVDSEYVVAAADVTEGEWTGFQVDLMSDGTAYPRYFKADVGEFQNGFRILESYTP